MKKETLEKLKRFAKDYFAEEKTNASRILAKHNIFIDVVGIEWSESQLNRFTQEKILCLFKFNPLKPYEIV